VSRALDGPGVGVEGALGERPVVVRAPVLDRVELAVGVEDADLSAVGLDDAGGPGRKLLSRADLDCGVGGLGHERGSAVFRLLR